MTFNPVIKWVKFELDISQEKIFRWQCVYHAEHMKRCSTVPVIKEMDGYCKKNGK
jgi:hypothetical protein